MSEKADSFLIEDLKKLLEKGVPLADSIEKLGEERTAYIIRQLDNIPMRSNTVGGCHISLQYCGCENWK